MSAHRCGVHVEAADESRTPTEACGREAAWYSEDIPRCETGLWMCEEHSIAVLSRMDFDTEFTPARVAEGSAS